MVSVYVAVDTIREGRAGGMKYRVIAGNRDSADIVALPA